MNSRSAAVLAILLVVALPSWGALERVDPFSLGEPLVLSLRQGRFLLQEGVLGFLAPEGKLYLPLEEVCRGLGLAIDSDVATGRATGFYLAEENDFELDTRAGMVSSAGEIFPIPAGSVFTAETELYVDLAALESWLQDVRLIFSRGNLTVEVESDPPLPAVARFDRRGSQERSIGSTRRRPTLDLPAAMANYRLYSRPLLDVDSSFRWTREAELGLSLGVRGAHDLAGMGARWFLGLDGDSRPREARLTLNRKDPAGGLLRPLGLTEITLGDVSAFGTPLIGGASRGAGLRITNRPREVSRGATLDLRGELPVGWEAELYRDGVLVDFDVEPERGEYLFEDVPLFPGSNELTVVRHGPLGQREETRRTVRVGGDQPAPGRWYFQGSALLQERTALPLARLGGSAGRRAEDLDQGEVAVEARAAVGLKPGLSLGASLSTLSLDGARLAFAGLSTDVFLPGFDLAVDAAIDQYGGWAAGGRVVTELGGFALLMRHGEFTPDFRSPAGSRRRPLRRSSELRARRSFDLPRLPHPLQTLTRVEHEAATTGASRTGFRLGVSTSVGGVRLHNELIGGWVGGPVERRRDPLSGVFNLSLSRWGSLRAGLNYSLAPEVRLRSVRLGARVSLFDGGLQVNPSMQHELGGAVSVGVGLGWRLPQAEMSAQLNADSAGSLSASLGVRFSMSWRARRGVPHFDRRSLTTESLAYADVFIDDNLDGVRSPGERTVSGVRITPGQRTDLTDDRGSLVLANLSELVPTDVLLDEGSLPDPFLRPSLPGYRVSTRPGAPINLPFPLVWVADVEGTVQVTEEKKDADGRPVGIRTRGLGNVEIVVFDIHGKEVSRRRSEADGFFFIPSLPVGTYTLRMDAAQAKRHRLDDGGGIRVSLEADLGLLSGLVLSLRSSEGTKPPRR